MHEYDPNYDQGPVTYGRWGKASEMGEPIEKKSYDSNIYDQYARMMNEGLDGYDPTELDSIGQRISKEASDGEFTFDTPKPIIRDMGENIPQEGPGHELPTDLNRHSADDKKITESQKVQQVGGATLSERPKKVIQRKIYEQEEISNRELPTDIKINRREMDRSSGANMRKAAGAELSDDSINPIKLWSLLGDMWGDEWVEWEPETIKETAFQDGQEISHVNMGKIFALRALLKTDRVFSEPRIFEKVCIAFADKIVDWGTIQKPRVHEIAALIAMAKKFFNFQGVTEEVAVYTAGCAIADGFVLLPKQLNFCEHQFSTELALTIGDDALDMQEKLMESLKSGNYENLDEGMLPQYMRVLRCHFHVDDIMKDL